MHEKYGGVLSPAFLVDARRLEQGEPLAYVIGWIPFLDCKIFLDSRPLIPRPETEYWVEKAIETIRSKNPARELHVLDLFAGSGCIGVAVLKHLPNAMVDFGEIDPLHFPTIEQNIRENVHRAESRTLFPYGKIVRTDVYSNIEKKYDVILANPPYISETRVDRVEGSVIKNEPRQALFADEEGFALIRKTIEGLPTHLKPGGFAIVEHEPEHAEALQKLAEGIGVTAHTEHDQFGILRYSVCTL